MHILNECPEYYIQKCAACGAILQYSQDDILVKNKIHINNTGTFYSNKDHIVCAACGKILQVTANNAYVLIEKSLTT